MALLPLTPMASSSLSSASPAAVAAATTLRLPSASTRAIGAPGRGLVLPLSRGASAVRQQGNSSSWRGAHSTIPPPARAPAWRASAASAASAAAAAALLERRGVTPSRGSAAQMSTSSRTADTARPPRNTPRRINVHDSQRPQPTPFSSQAEHEHIKGGQSKSLWSSYTSLSPNTRIKLAAALAAFAILGIVVSDKLEERLPPPALPARGELAAGNTELLHDEPERDARGR